MFAVFLKYMWVVEKEAEFWALQTLLAYGFEATLVASDYRQHPILP
jgi:hypothetical protein